MDTSPSADHQKQAPAAPTRAWLQFARQALLLLPLLALLPLIWRFGDHAIEAVAYPWQIDYDEGIVLHSAWRIVQGEHLYPPLEPETFTSSTYPPVYYLLTAATLLVTDVSLLGGRVISLASTLALAVLLGGWVAVESRSRLAGFLTGALWLSLSPVYIWGVFVKPDMLALALTVGGLVWARRWPVWPGLLGAATLFALAFLTKQSALVGPAAVGLWMLGRGGPWRSFALVMAGLLAVPFALLNRALDGGLWLHLVVYQQIPWLYGQLIHQLDKVTETYPWLLLASALALGWLIWRQPRWPSSLPLCYLLAAAPVVVLINGRANVNYSLLLDLVAPLCLLVGLAAGAMSRATGWRLAPAAALSGLLLAQAVIPNPPGAWYSQNRMPSDQRAARMENIAQLVEETEGPILSEDLYLLLRADKKIKYDDTFMMARTAERGVWDEEQLIADLEGQRFALVLLEYDITGLPRSPRWSPEALEALQDNYEILYRDVLFVHQPEP